MRCPHCDVGIHENFSRSNIFSSAKEEWNAHWQHCSECNNLIIRFQEITLDSGRVVDVQTHAAYPRDVAIRPVPPEVPDPYNQDFVEAVSVLNISAKASAALSRRNLQAIIHDMAGVKGRDLNVEIQTVIDSGKVPSHISEGLHAVRHIGNFAAHPIKSTSSGEIVDVEVGEAEWNLDVLESLFDFYFVQPAITAKRKAELNKKLQDAGKPPIT